MKPEKKPNNNQTCSLPRSFRVYLRPTTRMYFVQMAGQNALIFLIFSDSCAPVRRFLTFLIFSDSCGFRVQVVEPVGIDFLIPVSYGPHARARA